jgi:hypothetical protein
VIPALLTKTFISSAWSTVIRFTLTRTRTSPTALTLTGLLSFQDIPKDDFKAQFKDAELSRLEDWRAVGDSSAEWVKTDTVRVAEYFYKTHKEIDLVMLATGEVIPLEPGAELPPDVAVKGRRKSVMPAIEWCKTNGVEILERTAWPGQWIPIIPVIGDELIVNGKRILEGVIRHARDPQRMLNFWASAETEAIALAPKAPFIGAAGQFEGFERDWEQANQRNVAFLQYNPKSLGGAVLPAPQRNAFEPAVMAITNARMQASEDLKATTGIYDAALGARSNENSGIAIQRRNQQAQTSNFHFADNLSRSIRHLGRILVDLIPKVYDTPRAVRIIGEDGEVDMVRVNEIFEKGGEQKAYMLNKGKYDVTISTGPSYATKRQEAVASMLDLTKAYPQIAQVAGDLLVKNFDWPGSQEIAERLKRTLPPGVADDPKKDQQSVPPQIQAQMEQMNHMIDQLTKSLHAAHDQLDTRKMELESKERIASMQTQAEVEIALAKIGSQESVTFLKQQIEDIKHRLQLLNFNTAIDSNEGGEVAALPMNQPPTGGPSPGQYME